MKRYNSRPCACGCGETTQRDFAPGHDRKLQAALERACGGILELRKVVEDKYGSDAIERELQKGR